MSYRPRTSSALLIRRAVTQTLRLEVWDDSALAAPTAGTFSLWDASDTLIVEDASVTVVANVATYSLAAASIPATLPYSDAWRAQWSLTLGGTVEVFDQPAALVRNIFRATVVPGDLVGLHSEFGPGRELDPQQDEHGPSLGFFITEAEIWIEDQLWQAGRRAELVLDNGRLRAAVIAKALEKAFRWASTFAQDGSRLIKLADDYGAEAEAAFGRVQFRYDAAETGRPATAPKLSGVSVYILTGNRSYP